MQYLEVDSKDVRKGGRAEQSSSLKQWGGRKRHICAHIHIHTYTHAVYTHTSINHTNLIWVIYIWISVKYSKRNVLRAEQLIEAVGRED